MKPRFAEVEPTQPGVSRDACVEDPERHLPERLSPLPVEPGWSGGLGSGE